MIPSPRAGPPASASQPDLLSTVDKKNTTLGIVFLIAAVAALYWGQTHSKQAPTPAQIRQSVAQPAPSGSPVATSPAAAPAAGGTQAAFQVASPEKAGASVVTLGNDYVRATFTDAGGAIRDVALLKYPATLGSSLPFDYNQYHAHPILGIVDFPGLDSGTRYALVSQTADSVTYRAVFNGTIEVTRKYVLSATGDKASDPYRIRVETSLKNLTDKPTLPMRIGLSVGTAAPNDALDNGINLNTGYSNGKDQNFIPRRTLESSGGFAGFGAHDSKPSVETPGPIVWATAMNQFFASIYTPEQPAAQLSTTRVKLLADLPDANPLAYGLSATAQFDVPPIAAHASTTLNGDVYVGPKEYRRLANDNVFKHDEDKVMNYGFFKFFAQSLVTLMEWFHALAGNWGVAIILATLTLKLVFLPFTLAASRSAKRMAKAQPELKEIREKYKDNPQKQQTATMEVFKKHKVNPVGGCLPVLIQMPFFFGFYRMLNSATELRFQGFLWAHNLAAPDTIGHLFGYPINLLPLILVAVMIVQMQLTPTPTVDNSQATMMKFMPLIMMFIYYSFACSLALYSTINGLFTIGQQMVINRSRDAVGDATFAAGAKNGKGLKNVTPKKK